MIQDFDERNPLTKIFLEISQLKERLSILEINQGNYNNILSEETRKRQKLEKNTMLLANEINEIRLNHEHFEESMERNNEKFKKYIYNNLQNSNSNLFNLIENNLKSKKYIPERDSSKKSNKISEENIQIKNNDDNRNMNNSHSFENSSGKMEQKKLNTSLDKLINEEFNQYRTELNKNIIKMEFLEKKINELSIQNNTNMNKINNAVNTVNESQKEFESFHKEIGSNLTNIETGFNSIKESNRLLQSEIYNIIGGFQENLGKCNENYEKNNKNCYYMENLFNEKVKNLFNDMSKELDEFSQKVNHQLEEQNKEIENFEKHILDEHDRFQKFVQNHIDESGTSIRKLFDFNIEDINKIKKQMEVTQDVIKKVRTDVYNSLEGTEAFLNKKIDSLFNLIGKE